MMSGRSDLLKNTFSKVIADYEAARPVYPVELKKQIEVFSGIQPGAALMEVGAGTGQATGLFLEDGYPMDLLEVSGEQVRFLREKYGAYSNIRVKQGYFEEYEADRKYDLIYSATAFHWVKSDIGYPKAWHFLKDGGTLAVFWHMSSVVKHEGDVFDGLNAIRAKYLPDVGDGFDEAGVEQVRQKRIAQIQSGGWFGMPQIHEYVWTDEYDADRYAALINTYSDTQLLNEAARTAYLDEIRAHIQNNGGSVQMPQHVMLYLVRKT